MKLLVMSNSLQPHWLQHTRFPCPSPTSRACSNSRPLSQWCNPSILCSVTHSPPAFNLSQSQGLFKWVLRIRCSKCWSFSFSLSTFNGYSGLISFRIDWFHLLAAQGTRNSFLQHHSRKASILRPSTFFMIQLSHSYIHSFIHTYYWKNHSFDWRDICWQSNVCAF